MQLLVPMSGQTPSPFVKFIEEHRIVGQYTILVLHIRMVW